MIHSHGVIFSPSHAKKIEEALMYLLLIHKVMPITALQRNLKIHYKVLLITHKHFFSPEFVSMHPAGGKTTVNKGLLEWCPCNLKWPPPEGKAKSSHENPLSINLEDVLNIRDGVQKLHIDTCNKTGLHKCSSYCLKKVKAKKRGEL